MIDARGRARPLHIPWLTGYAFSHRYRRFEAVRVDARGKPFLHTLTDHYCEAVQWDPYANEED